MSEQNKAEPIGYVYTDELPNLIASERHGDYLRIYRKAYEGREMTALFSHQSPAPIPEQVAQADCIEGLPRYGLVTWSANIRETESGEYVKFVDVEHLLATQSAKRPSFSEADIPADAPRAFAKRYSALLARVAELETAAQSTKQGAQPLETAAKRIYEAERFSQPRPELGWSEVTPAVKEYFLARASQASVEQATGAKEEIRSQALEEAAMMFQHGVGESWIAEAIRKLKSERIDRASTAGAESGGKGGES